MLISRWLCQVQKPGQWAYLSLYQIGIHSHPFTINSQPKSGKVVFLLRAKHGLTRALYDRADVQLPPSSTMRYSLEGPYGGMYLPPASFDTVLLVAGGVGASFTMSLLTSLMIDPGCCRRVQVLWMELLGAAGRRGRHQSWRRPRVCAHPRWPAPVRVPAHARRAPRATREEAVSGARGSPLLLLLFLVLCVVRPPPHSLCAWALEETSPGN